MKFDYKLGKEARAGGVSMIYPMGTVFADRRTTSLKFSSFAKETSLYALFPSDPDLDAALCIQLLAVFLR
jgi:hypothetical protein